MYKKIKLICSKEQLNILLILFFGSIISTFFEFVGLGSIPLFAMMLLDIETFKESLPNFIDANFFDNFTQGDIAFYGTIILISIFVIKNSYLALMVYVQGKAIQSIHTNLAIKLFKPKFLLILSPHLELKLFPFIVKKGLPIKIDSKEVVTPGYGKVSSVKLNLL